MISNFSNAALFTNVEFVTNANVIDIQNFFKRTTNIARLNEGEKNEHKLKKIRRENQRADLNLRERV